MEKFVLIILAFTFVMMMPLSIIAAPVPKVVPVAVLRTEYTVNVNEAVNLTALTHKHGSSYTDKWLGGVKAATVFDAHGNYVSNAIFSSPVAGTYYVSYGITMRAGKSGVTFVGESKLITIRVVNPAFVVGAVLKNIVYTPIIECIGKHKQAKIVGYDVVGDVYATWSDGQETPTGVSAGTYFGAGNDKFKFVEVTFTIGRQTYSGFYVTFIRPI